MIEIRQVREEELDSMLECMTTAFGVAKDEWADGFYNGLYSDLKWKRVVVSDGKVVSCLVIIPSRIYIRGLEVAMGGIAGVATLPDERRHGYAGMLMANSVHTLRELGFPTSALYPFSFKYYRKFGWEFAAHVLKYSVKPEFLPRYSEAWHVRPFRDDDLPDVMRLYHEHYRDMSGPFVRDEAHWRRHILPRAAEKSVFDSGGVQGYLLGKRVEEEEENRYRIHEMIASTDDARRGLVGFLAKNADADRIVFASSRLDLESLGLLSPRGQWEEGYDPRAEIKTAPDFQFRIIDLREALKPLASRNPLDGELSIAMKDEIGTWNEPVTIKGSEVEARSGANRLSGGVRTLSQIYIGYLSPEDALSQGLIQVSGDALRLAENLFPQTEPFIPKLDEF